MTQKIHLSLGQASRLVLAALVLSSLLSSCCTPPAPASGAQAVTIETLIDEVKQALGDVQNDLATADLPSLKKVSLTLQTVATKQAGASLKLWVITLGGSVEKDSTQQIDIVLTPPKAGGSRNVSAESVAQQLKAAIVSVAEGVKKAGQKPNPLVLSTLDVQISFTVKANAKGDAIVEILPLGPDISGSLSKSATQTLKVSFDAKPDN
jgi:hypothetical protein